MERLKSISCEQKLWDILRVYFMPTNVSNKQHARSAATTPAAVGFHQRLKKGYEPHFFFLKKMVYLPPPPRIGSNSIPSNIMQDCIYFHILCII